MSLPRIAEILEKLDPISIAPADHSSVNAYADVVGGKIDSLGKTRVVFTIKNTDVANSIDWKVLASIDDATYVEVEAEASLAAGVASSWVADATETSYRFFKIQVKSTVGGSHGKAQVRGYAKM